ncbi:MAG: ornithine cyclodeaminase [Anaerolineales bacterium]|nr:ornithine cyclodeaminase [Anaerolineales bacterium]
MLILNASAIRQALPMRETIEAMKAAYATLSAGRADIPLRTSLSIPSQEATALFMPAYVPGEEGDALTLKIVTLFPHNVPAGLPFIHAAVLVMDASTGQMLALLEGGTLTAIRTGAAGGAAADLLARPDSHTVALFGAGVQARTQLEAVCAVRPIEKVWIHGLSMEQIETFIADMTTRVRATLLPAESPRQALAEADIICAATTTTTPLFDDADLRPGTHVTGVGSYTPAMIEIPPATVARARVVVDSRSACQAEAGEIIRATEQGLFDWQNAAELGEIVLGQQEGRTSLEQITFFKSVGVAVQDAAAAKLALLTAKKLGLGQKVAW